MEKKTEAIEFIDNIREPLRDLEESNKETSLNYIQNLCVKKRLII